MGIKELESFIKENTDLTNNDQIRKMIKIFKTQFLDPTVLQHLRRAAILGMTTLACMIKPNNKNEINGDIIKQIIISILLSFRDSDPKIVLSAGMSMYDIMRNFPQSYILKYFNEIFEGLLTVISLYLY